MSWLNKEKKLDFCVTLNRNGQKAERKTSRETWLLRGREVAAAIDRPSGALGLGEATITPGPTFTKQ